MTRDELFNVLALVLLVLPFIDWTAVVILLRALRRRPDMATLRDRFLVAFGIAGLTTLLSIAALSRFGFLTLSGDLFGIALAAVAIFLSLVQLLFIWRYWRYAW